MTVWHQFYSFIEKVHMKMKIHRHTDRPTERASEQNRTIQFVCTFPMLSLGVVDAADVAVEVTDNVIVVVSTVRIVTRFTFFFFFGFTVCRRPQLYHIYIRIHI